MQPKINRINSVQLPEDRTEALNVILDSLFGEVLLFEQEGVSVIRPDVMATCHTYAVIDAMKKSDISVLLDAYETEWECLWKGDSEEHFAFFAPYIVKLDMNSPFTDWLLTSGWGNDWGIFIRSYLPLNTVTHRLRRFNQIYDEVDGHWVMFRYYSPSVVKNYIPYLPVKDFIEFTDGMTQIIAEDPLNNRVLFV